MEGIQRIKKGREREKIRNVERKQQILRKKKKE